MLGKVDEVDGSKGLSQGQIQQVESYEQRLIMNFPFLKPKTEKEILGWQKKFVWVFPYDVTEKSK